MVKQLSSTDDLQGTYSHLKVRWTMAVFRFPLSGGSI